MTPRLTPADLRLCGRAFRLLGVAEAVIARLLEEPSDHTARMEAERWKHDLEELLAELDDPTDE